MFATDYDILQDTDSILLFAVYSDSHLRSSSVLPLPRPRLRFRGASSSESSEDPSSTRPWSLSSSVSYGRRAKDGSSEVRGGQAAWSFRWSD